MDPMHPSEPVQGNVGPLGIALPAHASLDYTIETRGLVPLPVSERGLPCATALPFFKVSDNPVSLEGPAFERNGDLVFVDPLGHRVLRLSAGRKLTTVHHDDGLTPAGIAIHKDGRIFVAALGAPNSSGRFDAGFILAMQPDGSDPRMIVPPEAGFAVDDLVFDDEGGLYFTDFRGSSTEPTGGVYYVAPETGAVECVIPNMCAANGVALSPDGQVLWATEFGNGRLHRAVLDRPGAAARHSALTPYHFVGPAPDSMRTDSAGNVYVAIFHQARILVFSPYGIPIGHILLPGREDGHFLKSTSLALLPGSRDLVIVARDEIGDRGAVIFAARGLAEGFPMFSHQ